MPEPVNDNDDQTPPETFDSFSSTLLQDLGLAVGQTPDAPAEGAPPPAPVPMSTMGMPLGDHARMIDERNAEAASNPPPAPAEPPKDASPATPAPATPPPAAAPAPPAEKPVVVKKKKPINEVVSETVRQVMESQRLAATPPAPAAPELPKPDPYEETLTEGQKEELIIARLAAKRNPQKHGNLPERFLAFYKKVDGHIEKARTEQPDRTLDETDQDFQSFLRANKPALDPVERRRLERELIKQEVTSEWEQKQSKVMEEVHQRQHVLEVSPAIQATMTDYERVMDKLLTEGENSLSAPIVKRAKEAGWKTTVEEDPLFAPVVEGFQRQSSDLAREYLQLVNGVKPFDQKSEKHQWILGFIRQQGDAFIARGGEDLVRGGKSFLTVAQYHETVAKDPIAKHKYWTFTEGDVLERLADNTRMNIDSVLKKEEEKLTKAGYKREKPAKTAPPIPDKLPKTETTPHKKQEETSPRATSIAGPGAASGGPMTPAGMMSKSDLQLLGLPV